ncbi:unnamed protein product [Tetraodon nigroviridis]|uniref:(spotted green pufferfish) hypothetical protein n=1 Tax=Tetraodon nigroviridis TaxID=99883 RepID=Q4S3V6_TETNG|nr:unnamed protein product [Tetraodon nigroviridis]
MWREQPSKRVTTDQRGEAGRSLTIITSS